MTTNNKHFKTLLKEIASYTSIGRICEVDTKQNKSPSQEDDSLPPEDSESKEVQSEPSPSAEKKNPVPPTPEKNVAPEQPVEEPAPENNSPEGDSVESSEKAEAEDAIENVSFIKLNSDSGIKFLLNSILQPAIETNTLDSIAQDFAEKLNIKTVDDLNKFKDSSIQFKSVVGFDQILNAMESFVNG